MPPSQSQSQSPLPFGPTAQPRGSTLDALLRHALPMEPGAESALAHSKAAGAVVAAGRGEALRHIGGVPRSAEALL